MRTMMSNMLFTMNFINSLSLITSSTPEPLHLRKTTPEPLQLRKTTKCSDDLSEINIFYEMNDSCVKKHQFVCLEIDLGSALSLKCRILNRGFDCKPYEFCPKPLEMISKVLNRRFQKKSKASIENKFRDFELFIDNRDTNLRNGSFELTNDFIETINKYEVEVLSLKALNLTRLPLFHNLNALKEIRISDNSIPKLKSRTFYNLSQLYYLDLQHNKIELLDEMAFDSLPELQDLNLSNNQLASLPNNTFHSLLKLKELNLINNHIQNINPNFFGSDNKEFKTLDLTRNMLRSLNSVENLQYLEFLIINNNKLESVNCTVLYTLKNLQMIELGSNSIRRFNCDLEQLPSLYSISLKNNQLSNLPKSTFYNFLNQTKNLQVKGNPLNCSKVKWLTSLQSKFLLNTKATCVFGNKLINQTYELKDLETLKHIKEVSDADDYDDQSSSFKSLCLNWTLIVLVLIKFLINLL